MKENNDNTSRAEEFGPKPEDKSKNKGLIASNWKTATEKNFEYTKKHAWLLLVCLGAAFAFDRLIVSYYYNIEPAMLFSAFWAIILVLFYGYYWEKVKNNKFLWLITAATLALCLWSVIFDSYSDYGGVSMLVIFAVVVAITQYASGFFNLKQVASLAREWVKGIVLKPFISINHAIGTASSIFKIDKKSNWQKALIGVLISLGALAVILPLLMGADAVFGYYVNQIFYNFSFYKLFYHLIVIVVATLVFFSYLFTTMTPEKEPTPSTLGKNWQFDKIISTIVLASVLAVYVIFCGVQFTYLFGRAGLPAGLTYSEYAREGFWQLIVISGINLAIFGLYLEKAEPTKSRNIMIYSLLALTGLMLVSAAVRLGMYISTYGLTWLRLLSGWFIVFLGICLVLCIMRIIKPEMPLIATGAAVLLVWFVVLGYANPDALIMKYNLAANSEYVRVDDGYYYRYLSADAALAFITSEDTSKDSDLYYYYLSRPRKGSSLSVKRLNKLVAEHNKKAQG